MNFPYDFRILNHCFSNPRHRVCSLSKISFHKAGASTWDVLPMHFRRFPHWRVSTPRARLTLDRYVWLSRILLEAGALGCSAANAIERGQPHTLVLYLNPKITLQALDPSLVGTGRPSPKNVWPTKTLSFTPIVPVPTK